LEAVTDETSGRRVSEDRFPNSLGTGSCGNGGRGLSQSLAKLELAYRHEVLYIMGKEQMKIKAGASYVRKMLLHISLSIRDNTRKKMANLRVPTDKEIEVRFLKQI
jgi:KUP system potassium uptake protein